jgi:DNA-binding IclR family transcriptional regulator
MSDNAILEAETVDTVLSVERALLILKRLAELREEIGVRELSRLLGYSPPVTQKILNTLKVHGYVSQNENTDRYALGPAALQIGMAMLSQLNIVRVARPFMERLTEETGETTFLAIREGLWAIYVDKEVSANPIRMDADVGVSRPLNCTAVGKVFLAFNKGDLLSEAAAAGVFTKFTPNSIVDAMELKEELGEVHRLGYAIDQREFHPEAICVAAPIYGVGGKLIGSITTSAVATRVENRIDQIAALVTDAAAQISRNMGHADY